MSHLLTALSKQLREGSVKLSESVLGSNTVDKAELKQELEESLSFLKLAPLVRNL